MPTIDNTNISTVAPMVHQRLRMHHNKPVSKAWANRPGFSGLGLTLALRICTPRTGANKTATTQETNIATAITANRVKVYSPAELLLRPMGTKPATVTSVPVSIGNAVEW